MSKKVEFLLKPTSYFTKPGGLLLIMVLVASLLVFSMGFSKFFWNGLEQKEIMNRGILLYIFLLPVVLLIPLSHNFLSKMILKKENRESEIIKKHTKNIELAYETIIKFHGRTFEEIEKEIKNELPNKKAKMLDDFMQNLKTLES